jgi:membrane associated rhomboid family serine protease
MLCLVRVQSLLFFNTQSGSLANCLHILMAHFSKSMRNVSCLGASGRVCAMAGAAAILRPLFMMDISGVRVSGGALDRVHVTQVPTLVYAVASIIFEAARTSAMNDGIGHHVHVFGFIIGIVYGLLYRQRIHRPLSPTAIYNMLRQNSGVLWRLIIELASSN